MVSVFLSPPFLGLQPSVSGHLQHRVPSITVEQPLGITVQTNSEINSFPTYEASVAFHGLQYCDHSGAKAALNKPSSSRQPDGWEQTQTDSVAWERAVRIATSFIHPN